MNSEARSGETRRRVDSMASSVRSSQSEEEAVMEREAKLRSSRVPEIIKKITRRSRVSVFHFLTKRDEPAPSKE